MKTEHKLKRKESCNQTREKRKSQTCKVFEIKLDTSHLSKEKKLYLKKLFLESKWFYNSLIGSENIFKFNNKLKQVTVFNKDKQPETRELNYLSSQMKSDLKDRCISSIKMLSTKKKRQKQIGKLKFKSRVNSVPLRQYNTTYRIEDNYISIQGFKKHFKVLGLHQIPKESEFANANLIRKPSGYYLKITCFLPKEEKIKTDKSIGLDFGIKDNITDSNGIKYNFLFPETKRIKQVSRKFNKTRDRNGNKKRTQKIKQLYHQLQILICTRKIL